MIVSLTHGGLGNRLKNVVSCVKLQRETKLPLKVVWEKTPYVCNCEFNDLFKNKMKDNVSRGYKLIKYPFKPFTCWRFYVSDKDKIQEKFEYKKDLNGKNLGGDIYYKNYIDLEYNRIPDNIKFEYIDIFKSLKLIDTLKDKINKFSKKYFDDDTISVHIRSWSYGFSLENERSKHVKIDNFIKEMKKYKNNKFFLATDDKKIIIQLYKIFKERLMVYNRNMENDRNTKEGIQNDLIDLYLLSKNKVFIGSRVSTFTEVAWFLGGCTKNIIII